MFDLHWEFSAKEITEVKFEEDTHIKIRNNDFGFKYSIKIDQKNKRNI